MKITTKLAKGQYTFNQENETHLLVQLDAPKVEWDKKRAPICIVPVVDVSSSMSGAKIDYVRKSCRKLIDHLSPGDMIGIVAFGSSVQEIAPITEISQHQKEVLKDAVGNLQANGCTNMAGGLNVALNWVNKMKLPKNVVVRVVLFTDGNANIGVSGRDLLPFLQENIGNATVSCFGFGVDCDQELLADMSNQSDGNYAYIDSPDAALTAFARELGGLMSVYAQDIEVHISPNSNNEVVEVLNDEDVEEKDGSAVVKLRDILGEEQKFIVARVKLGSVEKPLPRKVGAFKVNVKYKDNSGDTQSLEEEMVKLKFVKAGQESKQEDSDVVLHRDRLLAGRAQDRAEELARRGDFIGAQSALKLCADSLTDESTRSLMDSIGSSYSIRNYASRRGTANLMRSFTKGRRVSYASNAAPEAARGAEISTDAAVFLADSFTKDDTNDQEGTTVVKTSNTADAKKAVETITTGKTNVLDGKVEITQSYSKKRSRQDW